MLDGIYLACLALVRLGSWMRTLLLAWYKRIVTKILNSSNTSTNGWRAVVSLFIQCSSTGTYNRTWCLMYMYEHGTGKAYAR